MSPVPSVYDHLAFNIPPQSMNTNSIHIIQSRTNGENVHLFPKRKSLPTIGQSQLKRRYTVTNISIPDSIRRASVNNHLYDRTMVQKSSTVQHIPAYHQTTPMYYRLPFSSSNIDFRPLITNGRKRFGPIPASSSMIIIKKKSPPPMSNQKPFIRPLPVDLLHSNLGLAVSPLIPSSLSYSSSSYSSSPSSTNVGNAFVPNPLTNNNNNNNNIQYTANTTAYNEVQYGHHFVHNHFGPVQSFPHLSSRNRIQLDEDDDLDRSTRIPSASSIAGEGYHYKSTIMMDSNVLRLIRRYDPGNSTATSLIQRRSLEKTRGLWNSAAATIDSPQPSDSSPFLSRRSLTTTYEDDIPVKSLAVPRLRRQEAVQEAELSPPPIPPPPPPVTPIRPILKYTSRSRSEFVVQPHQIEPLTIEIDPFTPPSPNESPATYQPLITTGTKRVCSALSKSELDLRLQQEQLPVRPPSPLPPPPVINQQQEKESYRPTLGRSKSSITIHHKNDEDEQIDDFDELSAPILPSNSCVEKLKQLFVTKSSHDLTNPSLNNPHRNESSDSNLHRSPSITKSTPIEPSPRLTQKPTTIVQNVTPTFKQPIYRNEKTSISTRVCDVI